MWLVHGGEGVPYTQWKDNINRHTSFYNEDNLEQLVFLYYFQADEDETLLNNMWPS